MKILEIVFGGFDENIERVNRVYSQRLGMDGKIEFIHDSRQRLKNVKTEEDIKWL